MKTNSSDSRKARAMLTVSRIVVYAILIFLSFLCLFSFYMLIINATRSNADLQGGFRLLPSANFLTNLKNAWNDDSISIPRGLANSFFVAACTALLTTYFSALTAYGLYAYGGGGCGPGGRQRRVFHLQPHRPAHDQARPGGADDLLVCGILEQLFPPGPAAE